MNTQAIAIHFADELCRTRALTAEETAMLCRVVDKQRRRMWTAREDRELGRLSRLLPAHVVAERIGRTPDAVRSRLRQMKRSKCNG